MLVLSRRKNEVITINGNIDVKILEIHGGSICLGVEAPKEVAVHRREVQDAIDREAAA